MSCLNLRMRIRFLKKIMKQDIFQGVIYIIISFNGSAFEFLSSNGENYFKFNGEKNRVEKVDLDFNKKSYDMDFIKIGFFINGQFSMKLGEEDYSV